MIGSQRQDDADRLGDVLDAALGVLVDDAHRALVLEVVVEELGGDVVLTTLSSNTPKPVSSVASSASSTACSGPATTIAQTIRSTASWPSRGTRPRRSGAVDEPVHRAAASAASSGGRRCRRAPPRNARSGGFGHCVHGLALAARLRRQCLRVAIRADYGPEARRWAVAVDEPRGPHKPSTLASAHVVALGLVALGLAMTGVRNVAALLALPRVRPELACPRKVSGALLARLSVSASMDPPLLTIVEYATWRASVLSASRSSSTSVSVRGEAYLQGVRRPCRGGRRTVAPASRPGGRARRSARAAWAVAPGQRPHRPRRC